LYQYMAPLASSSVAPRTISRRYLIGPLGYGLSFVLAFVSPWTSLALHALLAALFALPERKPTPRQTTRSAAAT
jgi:hypothetical protein